MRMLSTFLFATSVAGGAGAASAKSPTAVSGPVPVTGNVPVLCVAGTLADGNNAFDLGVLIDTTTGLLRSDLSSPPKVLSGGFCNAHSTISIAATPLQAVSNVATPPQGFSRTVDYSATAAGWTSAPAAFATGAGSNPTASQSRTTPFQGDVTVSIGNFTTNGGDALRLVADPSYLGTITVTLAVAS